MAKLQSMIGTYRPSLYVLASQVLAATLNAAAKFIETEDEAVHPFMILYVRMLITTLGCTTYLLLANTRNGTSKAHMLFGTRDVRWLLVLRAIGGVCSATGFFCMSSFGVAAICILVSYPINYSNRYANGFYTLVSMIYLTLSEATALTFIGPLGSLILTRFLSFATVKWTDCLSAVGALLGVMLIAQPAGIFSASDEVYTVAENTHKRLYGLGFGVFGFCGGVVSDENHRFVNGPDRKLMSLIL